MVGNSCVVDTTVFIEALRGDAGFIRLLESQTIINMPAIALGELLVGARRSKRVAYQLEQVDSLKAKCVLANVSYNTALQFSVIKSELMNIGKPIPENDMWIAAVSMELNLPLFTTDAHFKWIGGLTLNLL